MPALLKQQREIDHRLSCPDEKHRLTSREGIQNGQVPWISHVAPTLQRSAMGDRRIARQKVAQRQYDHIGDDFTLGADAHHRAAVRRFEVHRFCAHVRQRWAVRALASRLLQQVKHVRPIQTARKVVDRTGVDA